MPRSHHSPIARQYSFTTGSELGGEGRNRTYLDSHNEPTTVLKTAGATRHPSLSGDFRFWILDLRFGRASDIGRIGDRHRPFKHSQRRELLLSLGPHFLHNRIRIGKPSRLKLRIDVFTIHLHFERAAAGRHERQRFNILFQLEELLRQTDGMRLVVSGRAILNTDLQSHNAHNVGSRPPLVKVPAIPGCDWKSFLQSTPDSRHARKSKIQNPKSEMGLPWTDVPLTSAPERPVAARHSINLAL